MALAAVRSYQVLSDPSLREQYDLRGEESVSGAGMMDGAIFFTMLFGSEKFAPLIGELCVSL
jgi:DnaJ-class molecular chaperone